MLGDRIDAWTKTLTYTPRHYRHVLSNLRIDAGAGDGIKTRANYLVIKARRTILPRWQAPANMSTP